MISEYHGGGEYQTRVTGTKEDSHGVVPLFRVDISANAFVLLDPLLLGIFCDSICHSRETGGVTDKEIFVFVILDQS